MKPKAYLPIEALRSSLWKALRALTKTALGKLVEIQSVSSRGRDSRHERCAESVEEEGGKGSSTANGSSQASATSQKRGKEGQGGEEQSNQDEHPAKAPHVEVVHARGVASMAADEGVRGIVSVAIPGLAKGGSGPRRTAVVVVFAAEVEVGPLGDVARAGDVGCVGTQEVNLIQRRDVANARENDEPEEQERAAEEDNAGGAQQGVCCCQDVATLTSIEAGNLLFIMMGERAMQLLLES